MPSCVRQCAPCSTHIPSLWFVARRNTDATPSENAAGIRPDLIVLDMNRKWPWSCDGLEAEDAPYRKIRCSPEFDLVQVLSDVMTVLK